MRMLRARGAHLEPISPIFEPGRIFSARWRSCSTTCPLPRRRSPSTTRTFGSFPCLNPRVPFTNFETDRLHFKSVRTKEEHLASLKRSQSSLAAKIEGQDKKVAKMKEENKDLPGAKDKLREMRQEMIGLENTVMNEETRCVICVIILASLHCSLLT